MHPQILAERRAAATAAASSRRAARSVAAVPSRAPPAVLPAPAGELPLAGLLARAVQQRRAATLARQVGDVALGPLDAKQVAKAIAYYRQQPTRYTVAIMKQLQEAVGVEPTGRVDAPTVQAVAVWQRDNGGTPPEQNLPGVLPPPALKIDGMAGPRTLPRMFAHGLNVKAEAVEFGQEAQTGVIDAWHARTPQQRAAELVRLVNVHLADAGVPPLTPNVQEDPGVRGGFDSLRWQMNIGLTPLSVTPDLAQARRLVNVIYHEARHAEQEFRIAQLRATQLRRRPGAAEDQRLAAAIAAELQIPPRVAEQAVDAPLAAGSMQALIAQGWYDSDVGPGRAKARRVTRASTDAVIAADAAQERFDRDPTPANAAALAQAIARQERAFDAYRDLPLENDAWTTGPMTTPGVTRAAPAAPPSPRPASALAPAARLDGLQDELTRLVGAAPAP